MNYNHFQHLIRIYGVSKAITKVIQFRILIQNLKFIQKYLQNFIKILKMLLHLLHY
jgi:hypothetical protein